MHLKLFGVVGTLLLLSACGQKAVPESMPATADTLNRRGAQTIILGQPGTGAQRLGNGALVETASLRPLALPVSIEVDEEFIRVPLTSNDAASRQLIQAHTGDSIISAPVAGAPYGFVRQVTGVSRMGGDVVLATAEASLEDSVENMDLDEDISIPAQSLSSVVYANGEVYQIRPEDFGPTASPDNLNPQKTFNIAGINKSFDNSVAKCGSGEVKLSGSLNASLSGFLNVKIKWFSLKKVEAGVNLSESAKLTLDATCTAAFTKEALLLTLKYSTIIVWAGPVPIVMTPTVELWTGANGQVSAKVKYTVNQTFNGTYGVGYYKGEGFKSISQTTHAFTHSLDVQGSGKIRGWVGAKAGFTFYGVAFAYGYPKAFLEGTATYASNKFNYCLDGGLSIGVGARLKIFGKNLGEWEKNLGETRKSIICSNTGSPTPPPPPPPPPPGPTPPRIPCNSMPSTQSDLLPQRCAPDPEFPMP